MAHPQSSPRGYFAKKRITFGNSTSTITSNSTGMIASGKLYVSGLTSKGITSNSTAVILDALRIGTLASYITANSTGIKIGTKYISCNSTGNNNT
jgi:hypothetical protein